MSKQVLVVIRTPITGGSWARGTDEADVTKRAARIFKSDWKHLFKISKGHPLQACVYELEDHMDEVTVGDDCCFYEDAGEQLRIKVARVVEIPAP